MNDKSQMKWGLCMYNIYMGCTEWPEMASLLPCPPKVRLVNSIQVYSVYVYAI